MLEVLKHLMLGAVCLFFTWLITSAKKTHKNRAEARTRMKDTGLVVYHNCFGYYQGMLLGRIQWSEVNRGVELDGIKPTPMDAPPVRFPDADEAAKLIQIIYESWGVPLGSLSIRPYNFSELQEA